MTDDLTPRERAAVAAGFPADITYGELREELTRAWAIVDRQTAENETLRKAAQAVVDLLLASEPSEAVREAMPEEVIVRGDIDAAWAEVEAALPDGWHMHELTRVADQSNAGWLAVAGRDSYLWNGPNSESGHGPTQVAALGALAAALRGEPRREAQLTPTDVLHSAPETVE